MREFHGPQWLNPLAGDKPEKLKKRMSNAAWNAEVAGIPPDVECVPFPSDLVDALFVAAGPTVESMGPFIHGIDVARKRDATYITTAGNVYTQTPEIVSAKRLWRMKLHDQITQTADHIRQYPGQVIIDTSDAGGCFFADELKRELPDINPTLFKLQNGGKDNLCQSLISAVEQRSLVIREDLLESQYANADDRNKISLRWQMKNFDYDITDDGRIDYHGPGGSDDDGVISVGLTWLAARKLQGMASNFSSVNFLRNQFN